MLRRQPAWLSASVGLQVLGSAAEEYVGRVFIWIKHRPEGTAFAYS